MERSSITTSSWTPAAARARSIRCRMALPGNVTSITVTGTFLTPAGAAATGTVTLTPSVSTLIDSAGHAILASPVTATLNGSGQISIVVACTDNGTLTGAPFTYAVTIALGVLMTEPVGALIALKLTHTPFSVSSVLGLLALMGVSVETAVILVSYINKLRLEKKDIRTATLDASLLRLRPIMMTALVACLGLLPAALSTGIGSDTQKPFAIVIVAGLISRLFLGFFVNPVLYEMVAKEGDVLQV